jgi:hypothetical protein
MKISENFKMQEFLTPEDYKKIIATKEPIVEFFNLIDKKIVDAAEFIRESTNKPMIINTWDSGGQFSLRGLRPLNCKIGAKQSMHKKGKAFDFNVIGLSDNEVKQWVISNEKKLYDLGIRRMESKEFSPSWCHLDLKETKIKNKIVIFNP